MPGRLCPGGWGQRGQQDRQLPPSGEDRFRNKPSKHINEQLGTNPAVSAAGGANEVTPLRNEGQRVRPEGSGPGEDISGRGTITGPCRGPGPRGKEACRVVKEKMSRDRGTDPFESVAAPLCTSGLKCR